MLKDFNYFYTKYVTNKLGKKDLMDEFRALMESVFECDQSLQYIGFVGHTPYWNDGDICEHSESIVYLSTEGKNDSLDHLYDEIYDARESNDKIDFFLKELFDTPLLNHVPSTVLNKKYSDY